MSVAASYGGNMRGGFGVFPVTFQNLNAMLGPFNFTAKMIGMKNPDIKMDGAARMTANIAVDMKGLFFTPSSFF